jgi:hypothetical protein
MAQLVEEDRGDLEVPPKRETEEWAGRGLDDGIDEQLDPGRLAAREAGW